MSGAVNPNNPDPEVWQRRIYKKERVNKIFMAILRHPLRQVTTGWGRRQTMGIITLEFQEAGPTMEASRDLVKGAPHRWKSLLKRGLKHI